MNPSHAPSPVLTPAQQALAFSHTFHLAGEILRNGLTEPTWDFIQQGLPDLAATLPLRFDADTQAADHYDVLGLNVFAHEAIFLDDTGLLGGGLTQAVASFWHEIGYPPPADLEHADHIGVELDALAFLCAAEADAWADGLNHDARRIRFLSRRLLDQHLLRWLPALTLALRQHGHPFYRALIDLVFETVLACRASLTDVDLLAVSPGPIPEPPVILDDERTGLKDVAAYLLTPVFSGFYLSRAEIGRLGRERRLPHGFGDRQMLLTNLFRTAVQYDELDHLIDGLDGYARQWQLALDKMTTAAPLLTAPAGFWRARLTSTRSMLARIRQEIPGDGEATA